MAGPVQAEMISKEGLMLTNHHCVFDDIQEHRVLVIIILLMDFWARTIVKNSNKNSTASFLVSIKKLVLKY